MPEANQVHVDAALTNVSVAYRNNEYIADAVAPSVAVRKQSDKYFIYDSEREALRPTGDSRAPGAEASEVNFSVSTDSYFCEDHALETAIPDEERENADPAIQPDIDRTEFLSDKIGLNREIALETLLRTSSDITAALLDPAEQWSADENDPLNWFHDARIAIFQQCQKRANTVILPYNVFDVVRNHPKIIDRIKYSSGSVLNEQLLAQLLDVDRVLVPRAFKNTAAKGQSATVEPVWGTNAYMLYVPPRPALKQIALAYTFIWTGAPGNASGNLVERWREPRRKADMIRVQKYYDTRLIAGGAGYRFEGVIA
jgi:hypothetical protein